jgi:hypothetical protein
MAKDATRHIKGSALRVALALLCAATVPAHGQSTATTPKAAIYFTCTCEETVGSRLATAFRDLLATSPRFSESPTLKSSIYYVHVVSMDPTEGNPGRNTIYSVVLTVGSNYYVKHWVGQCGVRVW